MTHPMELVLELVVAIARVAIEVVAFSAGVVAGALGVGGAGARGPGLVRDGLVEEVGGGGAAVTEREALCIAANNGDLVWLRALIAAGVDVNARNDKHWSALERAAINGHCACLEALIAAGAGVNETGRDGCDSPLHFASCCGHVACVRALIKAGADVNLQATHPDGVFTNFTYALLSGNCRILKILLRAGADVHTGTVGPDRKNTDAWILVGQIASTKGWPNYVTRRRATFATLIAKATRNKLPHVTNLEIATFVEPPGGY